MDVTIMGTMEMAQILMINTVALRPYREDIMLPIIIPSIRYFRHI